MLFAIAGGGHARTSDTLLIANVMLASPERGRAEAGAVLIQDGRIVAVGQDAVGRHADRVIDGRGGYLAPGLIDSHVHAYNIPGLPWDAPDRTALASEYFRQAPRSYLYFGFTSLVELNAISAEAAQAFRSAPAGPRLHDCSQSLEVFEGFALSDYDPQEVLRLRRHFVHDRHGGAAPPEGFRAEDHTPAAAVRRIADEGARCVKVYYEDGFGGTAEVRWRMPSVAVMREVVEAAHDHGLPVVVHANGLAAQRFALDIGADVIGHGLWHWPRSLDADPGSLPPEVRGTLDEIAQRDVGYQPTMRVLAAAAAMFDPAFLARTELAHVLPEGLLARLGGAEGQAQRERFREQFADGLPDETVRREMAVYERRVHETTAHLARAGARFLFGTDTAVGMGWGNPPGLNGYLEMLAWVEAGVAPRDVFRAATIDNAETFGLADEVGTIAVGKRADLVLMRLDPFETVEAWNAIEIVIIDGAPFERCTLSAVGAASACASTHPARIRTP